MGYSLKETNSLRFIPLKGDTGSYINAWHFGQTEEINPFSHGKTINALNFAK